MTDQTELTKAVQELQKTCSLKSINEGIAFLSNKLLTDVGSAPAPGSPLELYTTAVQSGFYSEEQRLNSKYRECSVVALLVSQGADVNLALHVFIALMVGIKVNELIDIVFLAGIYCGVNRLTSSLRVMARTFEAIIEEADKARNGKTPSVLEVFGCIGSKLKEPPPSKPPAA